MHGMMEYVVILFVGFWMMKWLKGTVGGIRIVVREVKFLDHSKTNYCESICQECFHWSRTKVRGSKAIRYRPSSNHKLCQLAICFVFFMTKWEATGNLSRVMGEVWLQSWNLKELTEGPHQEWSLRLNLTQHGKTYLVLTLEGLTDW